MKIILANLPHKDRFVIEGRCQRKQSIRTKNLLPPITLAYISSLLKGKADVVVIDSDIQSIGLEEFLYRVSRYKPDYLMASVSTPTIDYDMQVLKKVKKVSPETCNVIFGIHASYFSKELIENDFIDFVIRGEPELTASEIPFKNPRQISGLTFKINGKISETENMALMKIDDLPYPDWGNIYMKPYRGCPSRCSFCTTPFYYGSKPRVRETDSVIGEIKSMKKKHGVNDFLIYSDNFISCKHSVKKLCMKMIEECLGIRWMCTTRVDGIDEEILGLMKRSGCWLISFGIESGSQEILNRNMKGITLENSRKAIETARRIGLVTYGHFIFGLPGETGETIRETLRFSISINLDFADFYIATPFPGSRLFEDYDPKENTDWSDFEYNKSVLNEPLELERVQRRAYLRFYLRPSPIISILKTVLKKKLGMI